MFLRVPELDLTKRDKYCTYAHTYYYRLFACTGSLWQVVRCFEKWDWAKATAAGSGVGWVLGHWSAMAVVLLRSILTNFGDTTIRTG